MTVHPAEFAAFMVRAGVLQFGAFTTKSGRNSPFFINTGNYRSAAQISTLGSYYAAAIHRHFGDEVTLLFGPAYKGIPLVVATAAALYTEYGVDVSYAFNRKEAKDHGEKGTIIGKQPAATDRIVIVEDVITAGTSVREVMPLLTADTAAQVRGVVVSVDRQEATDEGESALQSLSRGYGMRCVALSTIDEIVEALHNKEIDGRVVIDDTLYQAILHYRKTYGVNTDETSGRKSPGAVS